jgi:hypothetical protein
MKGEKMNITVRTGKIGSKELFNEGGFVWVGEGDAYFWRGHKWFYKYFVWTDPEVEILGGKLQFFKFVGNDYGALLKIPNFLWSLPQIEKVLLTLSTIYPAEIINKNLFYFFVPFCDKFNKRESVSIVYASFVDEKKKVYTDGSGVRVRGWSIRSVNSTKKIEGTGLLAAKMSTYKYTNDDNIEYVHNYDPLTYDQLDLIEPFELEPELIKCD